MTLRLEPGAQERTSAVQLRLAGALGDAEHLRCLRMRVPIDSAQNECVSRAVGQCGNGSFDLTDLDRRVERPLPRRVRRLLLRLRRGWRQFGLRRCLAAQAQDHVYRDAVYPGSEAAPRLETLQRAPGVEECFLRAVFGTCRVACQPQTEAVHVSDVVPIEALEGAHISSGSALHEGRLPLDRLILRSRDHALRWTHPRAEPFKAARRAPG